MKKSKTYGDSETPSHYECYEYTWKTFRKTPKPKITKYVEGAGGLLK